MSLLVTSAIGVDMERVAVEKVPDAYPFVFGYCSGLGDVPWTSTEWLKYNGRRVTRTYQGAGTFPGIAGFDELDIETGALTPQQAADLVQVRVAAGHKWTGLYGSAEKLTATCGLIQAKGHAVWDGHVYVRLADWNLNQAQAELQLGRSVAGATIVAVQWASPSSNPGTVLPGTKLTLSEANVDLNVVDATLIPGIGFGNTPAPPGPPAPSVIHGFVVHETPFGSMPVQSTDNGKTWH